MNDAKAPTTTKAPTYAREVEHLFMGPLLRRVWTIDLPDPKTVPVDQTATIGYWLIDAIGDHPLWRCYTVALITLADIEGQSRPAVKFFPEATHEVLCHSLSPDHSPDPDRYKEFVRLTPHNFEIQFAAKSDATARRVLDLAMRAVADGLLTPDDDGARAWQAALGATAKHLDEGRHPLS